MFDQAKRIQKGTEYTEFSYGLSNQRIKRVDSNNVDGTTTTRYFGSVERIEQGATTFFRRYIGGVAIAEFFPATNARNTHYLIKDHLGSIHTAVRASNGDRTQMSFGAFGERRTPNWQSPLSSVWKTILNANFTTRGFTGHEHADGLGIIHMNGRIYDPKLGRMLQADPFVQDPKDSQSLNRYSYVLNNPLSYTDPSGYFSLKSLWKKIRPYVGIAVVIAGNVIFPGSSPFLWGALGGYISSGNITGALVGAFGAVGFVAIGGEFASLIGRTLASGAWGGFMSFLGGGKFGHGFVSAGFTQALSGRIGAIDANNAGFSAQRTIAAAVVGGTASELTGGKFANGAVTGAFSYAASEMARSLGKHGSGPGAQGTETQADEAIEYLKESKAFRKMYRRFQKTGAKIEVNDGFSGFDAESNTVLWDPTDHNLHALGINSSALSLAHEMGHAVRFFENPEAFLIENIWPTNPATGLTKVSLEELRNLPLEQRMAGELGEPIRQQYPGTRGYNHSSVIFSCFAGQPGCN